MHVAEVMTIYVHGVEARANKLISHDFIIVFIMICTIQSMNGSGQTDQRSSLLQSKATAVHERADLPQSKVPCPAQQLLSGHEI